MTGHRVCARSTKCPVRTDVELLYSFMAGKRDPSEI